MPAVRRGMRKGCMQAGRPPGSRVGAGLRACFPSGQRIPQPITSRCCPALPHCCHPQASLLEKAKELAEAAADGAPTSDCVLTVPSYFTPVQRQVGGRTRGGAGREKFPRGLGLLQARGFLVPSAWGSAAAAGRAGKKVGPCLHRSPSCK